LRDVVRSSLRAQQSNPALPQQRKLDCLVACAPRNDDPGKSLTKTKTKSPAMAGLRYVLPVAAFRRHDKPINST
jgi:hypothetical protein